MFVRFLQTRIDMRCVCGSDTQLLLLACLHVLCRGCSERLFEDFRYKCARCHVSEDELRRPFICFERLALRYESLTQVLRRTQTERKHWAAHQRALDTFLSEHRVFPGCDTECLAALARCETTVLAAQEASLVALLGRFQDFRNACRAHERRRQRAGLMSRKSKTEHSAALQAETDALGARLAALLAEAPPMTIFYDDRARHLARRIGELAGVYFTFAIPPLKYGERHPMREVPDVVDVDAELARSQALSVAQEAERRARSDASCRELWLQILLRACLPLVLFVMWRVLPFRWQALGETC